MRSMCETVGRWPLAGSALGGQIELRELSELLPETNQRPIDSIDLLPWDREAPRCRGSQTGARVIKPCRLDQCWRPIMLDERLDPTVHLRLAPKLLLQQYGVQ